jgi:hypothetical protein
MRVGRSFHRGSRPPAKALPVANRQHFFSAAQPRWEDAPARLGIRGQRLRGFPRQRRLPLMCPRWIGTMALVIALRLAPALRVADWPQWRGPNRDAVWSETGLLQFFPPEGLKVLWTHAYDVVCPEHGADPNHPFVRTRPRRLPAAESTRSGGCRTCSFAWTRPRAGSSGGRIRSASRKAEPAFIPRPFQAFVASCSSRTAETCSSRASPPPATKRSAAFICSNPLLISAREKWPGCRLPTRTGASSRATTRNWSALHWRPGRRVRGRESR